MNMVLVTLMLSQPLPVPLEPPSNAQLARERTYTFLAVSQLRRSVNPKPPLNLSKTPCSQQLTLLSICPP